MNKESKSIRNLDMNVRLCEGKIIHKQNETVRFWVDEKCMFL